MIETHSPNETMDLYSTPPFRSLITGTDRVSGMALSFSDSIYGSGPKGRLRISEVPPGQGRWLSIVV
jgi:hypothetical protein